LKENQNYTHMMQAAVGIEKDKIKPVFAKRKFVFLERRLSVAVRNRSMRKLTSMRTYYKNE